MEPVRRWLRDRLSTPDEQLESALGRMTREYAFLDSCLRGLLHSLRLFERGSEVVGAQGSPSHFAELIKEIRRHLPGLPTDQRDALEQALASAKRLHDRRVRLSHDQIGRDLEGKDYLLAEWRPDSGWYAGKPLTIQSVWDDASSLHEVALRLGWIGASIRNHPQSRWVTDATEGSPPGPGDG